MTRPARVVHAWILPLLLALVACGNVTTTDTDTDAGPGQADAGAPDGPGCRADDPTCTVCAVEADCAGIAGQPFCADDHACVGCRNDADCATTGQACLETTRACGACTADADCESGICDETNRACIAADNIAYVAATGSGTVCTQSTPCATLALAHSLVTATRRHILVAEGRYQGASLTGKPFELTATRAAVTSDVTIQGDITLEGLAFDRARLFVQQGPVRLRRLQLADAPRAAGDILGAIHVIAGTAAIEDTRVERSQGFGISMTADSNVTIARCQILNNNLYGIALTGTAVIRESRIIGNGTGIGTFGTRPNITVVNNVIAQHRAMGLYIGGNPGFFQVEHNTIAFNQHSDRAGGVDCIDVTSRPTLLNNIIWGNSADIDTPQVTPQCSNQYSVIGPIGPAAGTGNINADPRFVDAASNDYKLLLDSPARDTADPAANRTPPAITVTTDIEGKARPSGVRSDIGAYELAQ